MPMENFNGLGLWNHWSLQVLENKDLWLLISIHSLTYKINLSLTKPETKNMSKNIKRDHQESVETVQKDQPDLLNMNGKENKGEPRE